jgi:hypothetical protein
MINTQRNKNLCTKIYVSPFSDTSDKLLQRDRNIDESFLVPIDNCDGTMQGKYYDEKETPIYTISSNARPLDLVHKLDRKFGKTRLVILDYAGLSTNVRDIKSFFR